MISTLGLERPRRFAGTDRFQLIRPLGSGAMGEVFEAHDREHDARVALKVLRRHDPRFVYRFKHEFRAVQALQHPNLASLGQLHEDQAVWFFTMELVEGTDFLHHVCHHEAARSIECDATLDVTDFTGPTSDAMSQEVSRHSRLAAFDEARLRSGLRQLCEALHFLHSAGKIHRDIKPSNVMVTPDGRVVLLDFGLVTDASPDRQSVETDIVGTPIYMAPEQATGRHIDHSVDCYALGVMLYEALTGEIPFAGTLTEILVKKQCAVAPDPRERVAGVPDDLARLCMRLLAAEPSLRPTAADVLDVLCGPRATWTEISLTGGRPAVFLGRDAELAALRTALADSLASGQPRVVHIEAQSGLGKTSLVDQFSDQLRADRPDVRLLSGRCYEREMTHYRAFDGVVDAMLRLLRELDGPALAAATPEDAWFVTRMFPMFESIRSFTSAAIPADAPSEHDARRRAYRGFCHVLGVLAERAPLVIVVDDLQWADSDSLRLLAELVRTSAPTVLWVLTSRPLAEDDPRGPAVWLRDALKVELTQLELAPLTSELAQHLAEQLLGGAGSRDIAAAIAAEAAGHPLHIAELVRHAAAGGGASRNLRLDDVILQRLTRLPSAAQEIAEVLALAGAPLRPSTLRRAAEVSPLDFQRAITVLRVGHLARRSGVADDELLEPYHDRVRQAVAGGLDDERRRSVHARLATALTADAAAPELLLRHFEGCGAFARAAECALDAAQRATTSMAYDRAVDLYQTALRLGSYVDDERRSVHLRLAEAFVRAGRGREAAAVFAEVADGADPDLRLHCRLQVAYQLLVSGYIDDGMRAVAALLDEIETPLPATPRKALATLIRHRVALALRGRKWTVRRESQVPRELLMRLDVYRAVSHGLSMVDNIRGAVFNALYLRLALRTGEPMRLCRALGAECLFLGSQGNRAAVDKALVELESLVEFIDAPYAHAWLAAAHGCLDYFAGRFWSAARTLERAENLFRESRTEASDIPTLRIFRGFALMHAGEVGALAPLHAQWLAEAEQRGDLYLQTVLRRGYHVIGLARGDVAGAAAWLDRASWTSATSFFHLQHWYEVQARVELALCRGEALEVVPVIDQCLRDLRTSHMARIQIVYSVARWLQARVHLAAARTPAEVARACKLARKAIRHLRKQGVGYSALWAELLTASERAYAGDRDGAVLALRVAAELGVQDLRMYGMVARHRLAAMVGGDEGDALSAEVAITARELGVAAVAPVAAVFAPGLGSA